MNAIISRLQELHPEVINPFLERLSLSRNRGHMPGLLLNGKQIEKIIKEDNLLILTDMLTKAKSKYLIAVEYLRCLRALHSLMVSKLLNPQYKTIINEFRVLFDKCFRMGLVTETPKCHILYCHLEEWFDERKETLWWADTSGEVTIMFNGEIHLIHFILQGVSLYTQDFVAQTKSTIVQYHILWDLIVI